MMDLSMMFGRPLAELGSLPREEVYAWALRLRRDKKNEKNTLSVIAGLRTRGRGGRSVRP